MVKLRHFLPTEKFGNYEKMDPTLLLVLDAWRHHLGIGVFVSRGYDEGAWVNSAHRPQEDGNAYAVDVIPMTYEQDVTLFDCFQLALKYDFKGIGIYPDWKYRNHRGGLHLDRHPNRHLEDHERVGTWVGFINAFDGRSYAEASELNLRKYGVL